MVLLVAGLGAARPDVVALAAPFTVALFLGIVVLWQMRKEPRPLPDALANQRLQARVGIALSLLGAAIIYTWVAFRGPGAGV